jgi:DNA-binding beta-propeller fold protein YncE
LFSNTLTVRIRPRRHANPTGATTSSVLPFTDLSYPYGVAVDAVGNVYVTDEANSRVVKLSVG